MQMVLQICRLQYMIPWKSEREYIKSVTFISVTTDLEDLKKKNDSIVQGLCQRQKVNTKLRHIFVVKDIGLNSLLPKWREEWKY